MTTDEYFRQAELTLRYLGTDAAVVAELMKELR